MLVVGIEQCFHESVVSSMECIVAHSVQIAPGPFKGSVVTPGKLGVLTRSSQRREDKAAWWI